MMASLVTMAGPIFIGLHRLSTGLIVLSRFAGCFCCYAESMFICEPR